MEGTQSPEAPASRGEGDVITDHFADRQASFDLLESRFSNLCHLVSYMIMINPLAIRWRMKPSISFLLYRLPCPIRDMNGLLLPCLSAFNDRAPKRVGSALDRTSFIHGASFRAQEDAVMVLFLHQADHLVSPHVNVVTVRLDECFLIHAGMGTKAIKIGLREKDIPRLNPATIDAALLRRRIAGLHRKTYSSTPLFHDDEQRPSS